MNDSIKAGKEAGQLRKEELLMAIDRWRPFATSVEQWDPFPEIQSEMNRLFYGFFARPRAIATGTESRAWMPVADMHQTKDDLILRLELPGVSEKDVSPSIQDEVPTVNG